MFLKGEKIRQIITYQNRIEDAKDYERQILEAKNSIECDSILCELNNIYL